MTALLALMDRAYAWGLTRYQTIGYGVLLIAAGQFGLGDFLFLLLGALVVAGAISGICRRCLARTKTD